MGTNKFDLRGQSKPSEKESIYSIFISWIIIFFSIIYLISIEDGFPLNSTNFIFPTTTLIAASIFLYFLIKKIRFSILFSIILLTLIALISHQKKKTLGANLTFNDIVFFFQNTGFLLDYVNEFNWPLIIALLVFLTYILKVEKNPTEFKKIYGILAFLCMFIFGSISAYQIYRVDLYGMDFISSKKNKDHLLTFFASAVKSPHLLAPNEQDSPHTCCRVVHSIDQKIKHEKNSESLPNIVYILLESTTDISLIKKLNIERSEWRDFKAKPLQVYTMGGGTYVQEYALLHGVPMHKYGPNIAIINSLGPQYQLGGRLAPSLKTIGYTTTSVMPYAKSFYNTMYFHKSLGIETLIDCEEMTACSKDKFKNDDWMFDQVIAKLGNSNAPQFIFGLTLAQHSPHRILTKENIDQNCKSELSVDACESIAEYIRREAILKKQISKFAQKLNAIQRPTVGIFFGDHIPSDFSSKIPIDEYKNGDRFETVVFAYSNVTKSFFDISEKLGACVNNFKLEASDLDVIGLNYADFRSVYIDEKMINLKAKCKV